MIVTARCLLHGQHSSFRRCSNEQFSNAAMQQTHSWLWPFRVDGITAIEMNFSAFSSAGFRRYLIGNMFGLNSTWMLRLLVGWLAWDMTASAGFVGFVSFLMFAPALLSGPVFGVYADRVNIVKAALFIQSCMAAMAMVLLAVLVLDVVSPTFIAIFSFSSGLIFSAYHPVRMSLAPRMVEKDKVSSVIGFTAINFNISRLSGPAIG